MGITEVIKQLQNLVDEDSGRSIRPLALKSIVDEKTMCSCVHKDIKYKSFVLRRAEFMKDVVT